MKRFYLILLGVSLLSLSSFAGSLFPTVITPNADVVNPIMWYGKIWNVRYDFIDDSHQSLVLYSDVTESIVDGKTYVPICVCERKLIVRGVTLRSDINQSEATRLLYRQEGDKVYYLSQENNAEFILFDYGLKEGEKFKAQDGEQYVVTETGYFEEYDKNIYAPGQNKPRMLRLRADESGKEDVWIEGIGSVKWGIVPKYVLKASAVFKDTPIDAHVFRSSTNGNIAIYDYLFNINEENYKLINYELGEECSKEEDGLSFTFIEDTLCVSGAYCPVSSFGPECIECLVTSDNTIVMAFYGFHVITTNSTYRKIDVKIPGFKPGTYIFGTETLVCKGKDTNFYYYNGGKIPLTLNENKVVVSVPKEYDETSERIQANAGVLVTISDSFFQSFVITRSDFEKLGSLDSWEEDEKSVILTSSYFTENHEEVYATPYLSVRLKKEEDIDLLASYVEKYKLRFDDYKPLLPLWYVLSVTLESEKSPLQIANELYETGDFVAAAPDLADAPDGSDPDEDYTPFVEMGKHWHVLGFSVGPYSSVDNYCFGSKEVTIGEHTYLNLYKEDPYEVMDAEEFNDNGIIDIPSLGLFREEDRRVYLYDKDTEQEYCVYDFTLEVGDTFDIGIGDEAKQCVVTKVDHINVKGEELKTITFSSVNVSPTYGCEPLHINHTWVEGVGDLSEPTAGWKPNSYDSSWSHHVAYMDSNYGSWYYPFSFADMWGDNNFVFGQDLVRGEKLPDDTTSDEDELSYEIVDEKLHVTGTMWMQCGPNNYIYCKLKPSDTYNTYQITLQKEEVEPLMDCMSSYVVDLYFNLPYYLVRDVESFVYVDSEGEHLIQNREKNIPFIEEGKVWKTGRVTMPGVPAFDVNYYYLEGDTVIKSEQYQKLMRTNVTKERKVTVYNGALREEGKKVYYSGGLLYDFDAQIGDTLEVYGFPNTKAIIEKRDVVDLNGYSVRRTLLGVYGLNEEENEYGIINHDAWYEGIGYQAGPCEGLDPGYPSGMYYNTLMSCTIYNDTLYSDARYTDAVSEYWDEDSETKKQKIDFTHVIKTKPTSPQPVSTNISLLWGEYSNAVLNIDFEGMNGRYKINVRKDGEQQDRFSANQETHNLQSLDVNLAGYPDGDYTVVVENDEESYTAHFALPLDGTGIESIQNSKFKIDNNAPVYDLSGRRVVNPKRGLYIQGGKKIIR